MIRFLTFFDNVILDLIKWIIIGSVVMSWLIAFNVVNPRNKVVYAFWETLNSITEPVYRWIRRFLPNTGAVDFAPLVAILFILLLQAVVVPNIIDMLRPV